MVESCLNSERRHVQFLHDRQTDLWQCLYHLTHAFTLIWLTFLGTDELSNTFNIFLCSCCSRPTAVCLSFCCRPMLINPFTDCFHRAKLPTLFQKFCFNCLVSKTNFPPCLDRSVIFVRYFTHNQRCRPNCDCDLKY